MPDPNIPVSVVAEFLHSMLHKAAGSSSRMHRIAELLERRQDDCSADLRAWLCDIRTTAFSLNETLDAVRRYVKALDPPYEYSTFSIRHAAEAAAKALSLEIQIAGDRFPEIHADRSRVELVLRELIDNAGKFHDSRPACIQISSQIEASNVVLSVQDDGIGVDPRRADRIFKPFVRLGGDRFSGSGLGLTIARTLVQQWNGRIWVEAAPAPATGSVFRFYASPQTAW